MLLAAIAACIAITGAPLGRTRRRLGSRSSASPSGASAPASSARGSTTSRRAGTRCRTSGGDRSPSGKAASASGAASPAASSSAGIVAQPRRRERLALARLPPRPGSSSPRRSAASATGGTRSSSASRPTCRGGSRSIPRRPDRRTSSTDDLPPDVPVRGALEPRPPRLLLLCSTAAIRFRPPGALRARTSLLHGFGASISRLLRIDPSHEHRRPARQRVGVGGPLRRLGALLRLVAVALRGAPGGAQHAPPGRSSAAAGDEPSRAAASDRVASLRGVTAVRELELDLDAFEGPFDLLLTLAPEGGARAGGDRHGGDRHRLRRAPRRAGRARSRGLRRVPRPDRGAARAEGARALPRRGGASSPSSSRRRPRRSSRGGSPSTGG